MDKSMNIVAIRKNMAEALNKVAYGGERIVLERRGKGVAALVSMEDLELLRKVEDEYWGRVGLEAERRMKERGEKPIPFEEVERRIEASRKKKRKASRR